MELFGFFIFLALLGIAYLLFMVAEQIMRMRIHQKRRTAWKELLDDLDRHPDANRAQKAYTLACMARATHSDDELELINAWKAIQEDLLNSRKAHEDAASRDAPSS